MGANPRSGIGAPRELPRLPVYPVVLSSPRTVRGISGRRIGLRCYVAFPDAVFPDRNGSMGGRK